MEKNGEKVMASQLLRLPSEVLRHIASYLDIPSAISLLTTHSSLYDAGESRIWRDIRIPWHPPSLYLSNRVLLPDLFNKIEQEQHLDALHPTMKAVRDSIHFFVVSLSAVPSRIAHIRSIQYTCRRWMMIELLDLLQLVKHRLEILEVGHIPFNLTEYPAEGLLSLGSMLRQVDGQLLNLRHVRLGVAIECYPTLVALSTVAPKLEVLEIDTQFVYHAELVEPHFAHL